MQRQELQEISHRLEMSHGCRETEGQKGVQQLRYGHWGILESAALVSNRLANGAWSPASTAGDLEKQETRPRPILRSNTVSAWVLARRSEELEVWQNVDI